MKKIIKMSVILGAIALGATAIHAADDPIKARKDLMKAVGKSVGVSVKMIKGEMDYDAAKAKEAMMAINGGADKFLTLFPEGSQEPASSKSETSAKPEVWKNMDDFKKKGGALKEASGKAVEAAASGKAQFAAAFKSMIETCKGCHEKYRLKKN